MELLKTLDISKNKYLEDESIKYLMRFRMPALKYISVEGCVRLTSNSFDYIIDSRIGRHIFCINFAIDRVDLCEKQLERIKWNCGKLGMVFVRYSPKNEDLKFEIKNIEIILMD